MKTLIHDSYIDEKHSHKHGLESRTTWEPPARMWMWRSDQPDYSSPLIRHNLSRYANAQAKFHVDPHVMGPLLAGPATIVARTRVREPFEHIRSEIVERVVASEISPLTAVRSLIQLRYVLPSNAVYPHIVADDSRDLCFYWLAAKRRLEIVIPERGEIYVRAVGFEDLDCEGFCTELPRRRIRLVIQRISEIISNGNPEWRRIFDK